MTTATIQDKPPARNGLLGPLLLIGLGFMFLLNNLGIVAWSVWQVMFQFWPVFLIAVGLDILIGRRSVVVSLLVILITFGALGFGIWWLGPRSPASMPLVSQVINQPLASAKQGEINLSLGVGTLQLGAMAEPNGLITGQIETQQLDRIIRESSTNGDTAVFNLQYRQNTSFGSRWGQEDRWNFQLNPQLPISLHVNSGVGTSRLDLADLQISQLAINAGVGKTYVTFPRHGVVKANIIGGVGEVVVTLPQGVAARIELNRGLGNVTIPAGYRQEGEIYLSPGYSEATNRVDLHINGGVGTIQIIAQ
jgi:Domain of unknown function (DUF5668)/N-terminal domain of toast_rack, DUF2154